MEVTTDGAFDTYWQTPDISPHLANIRAALSATLDPRISNDVRQQALEHLEQLKHEPSGPQYGYTLADSPGEDSAVRYFGLQLLEFSVRYRWVEYGPAQQEQLRTWVECLAASLRVQDAGFIKNKVAQLWVEIAKRCWAGEWMDMDHLLLKLWDRQEEQKRYVHKVFVLQVLEMLSEDVVVNEDPVAGLRLEVLGAALNEVLVTEALYAVHAKTRGGRQEVRAPGPGWLARVCGFFSESVEGARMAESAELAEEMSGYAIKALNALRPTMSWISLRAAVEVGCVDAFFLPFHTEDVALQTAATETLHALLTRPYNTHWHDAWSSLKQQALRPDRVAMIRQAFDRASSAPGEDDTKYTLQRKMSELLSTLADSIAQHTELLAGEDKLDVLAFFDLLRYVLQSKSLVVSIPVLHSWSKMMDVQENTVIDMVLQALGTLVQTCSERLLRYENIPSDADNEMVQFLEEDFDTTPERHAFLGNYRRYCTSIIQAISRSRPIEALQYVLEQMQTMLQTGPYTGGRGFNPDGWSKNTHSVLQFDAQFNVVTSALKGFSLWCGDVQTLEHDDPLHAKAEEDREKASQALQEWSYNIISIHVDDPEVAAQVVQILVAVLRTVKPGSAFVLHVVQHLLTMRLYDDPSHQTFSEAVKVFELLRVVELQKLALSHANELLEVFTELEPRIGVLAEKHSDDPRLVWGYKAFLSTLR